MAKLPERMLSKSKMSMYLRSQCDRQLYLSLFSNKAPDLNAAGLPVPLKSRTNVQLVTQSGREFEFDQFDRLVSAIPAHVVHAPKYSPIALDAALAKPPQPAFILQPAVEPEAMRARVLGNLGLTAAEQKCVPRLTGLRPDVLYVHAPRPGDFEVLPDGSRRLLPAGEKRLAISVIDLKNVTEANASYAAEVCLYALFLANWLAADASGLSQRYFVSDRVYLWQHVEMPHFEKARQAKEGASAAKRIAALLTDLEEGLIEFIIYMPSVRKFFKEDVPRVVAAGDGKGWATVDYHVNPKCGACDFLGHRAWLWGDDLKQFDAHPDHYCLHAAETGDHLCKMAGLSKGASHILVSGGHPQVASLVGLSPTTPVLRKHALLKRDKSQIGARAQALATETASVDDQLRIPGLAKFLDAEFDIVVNFDAGAGVLTGVAVRGLLFAPAGQSFKGTDGTSTKTRVFKEQAFVVGRNHPEAEWAALYGFISTLSGWAAAIRKAYADLGGSTPRTQLVFWEARQYEELCNAFGRHLLRVLDLPDRDARALAWLFPAEELMERDEHIAPGIVFLRDIVDVALRLPVRFANTLLGVAAAYHPANMTPRKIDTYYQEPLGNAIPRERIYELWNCPTGVIRMFGRPVTLADATKRYGDVLCSQSWALASVAARLRTELRNNLQGNAPALDLSNPTGAAKVAYDSKLWIQWDAVEARTRKTEGTLDLIAKAERLEASYKAIVLPRLLRDLGGQRYEFEVSEESTEAKLDEGGSYIALGLVNSPGFPMQTALSLGVAADPPDLSHAAVRTPLHRVIAVTLESFDRVNRKAVISLRARSRNAEDVFDALLDRDLVPITSEPVCLLEGLPYDDSGTTERILKEVGHPSCATPAPEALLAMGKTRGKAAKGTDAVTPLARAMWDAGTLATTALRSDKEAAALATFATTLKKLNESQTLAVRECVKYQLAVMWGPPGTGKTDTLVALLHALVREGQKQARSRKILLTGPNYRAVEELAGRLLESLDSDPTCHAEFYWVYSRNRVPRALPKTKPHLHAASVQLDSSGTSAELQRLQAGFGDPAKVVLVATTAHIIGQVTNLIGDGGGLVQELYDLIVIDESSQVPVTLALRPLSALKTSGQLIVAGDHLQMPPIASLEPPRGAEHLVGSIQTYFLTRFKVPRRELLINYRSNQDLVDYARTLGYPPKLHAANPERRLECVVPLPKVISTLPAQLPVSSLYELILDPAKKVTALIHDDIVSSQANEVEAKLVAGLAYCLRHAMSGTLHPKAPGETYAPTTDEGFFNEGLGVVTPHKAQKALVLRELTALFPKAPPELIFEAVDTVERFQGGERHTVIVSFGVGDTDIIEGEEAFLLQMERTNVAVSRAKAKCIVLMPKALAYHLPTDPKAVKTSKAIKSYIEEFCSQRAAVVIKCPGTVRAGEVRWHQAVRTT